MNVSISDNPLEGIRMVGLSQANAGPLCGQLLGDIVAEAAEVEALGGTGALLSRLLGVKL